MEEGKLTSALENLFVPTSLPNYRFPLKSPYPVVYIHHGESGEPEEIVLDEMFPFQTIQDIKTYIYIQKDKQFEYHPAFQALLIPNTDEPSARQEATYTAADFAFVNVDKKGRILVTHKLSNPFSRMRGDVDERFVDAEGNRKVVKISDRSNVTMEDVFPTIFGETRPILHLFLFSEVVARADESTIRTNREWNGRIYPYFPQLSQQYETDLENPNEKRFLSARVTFVNTTIELMTELNDLITSKTVVLKPFKMVSLKFLRLLWKKPFREVPDVETLFYQIPTTYTLPFLRILPLQGVPITKLFVESALKIPSFDPRLIQQWAEQKAPSKDDFLFGKVMIRDKQGPEPALFGTLRVFDDRSADFIVIPPENMNRLLFNDIDKFPQYLEDSLKNSYLDGSDVEIAEAHIVCGIAGIGLKQVPKQTFLQRLKAFAPLFLEIPPLPTENPLVMLRYRAVSKFTMEDKVFTFLTQYNNRKTITGEAKDILVDMIETVMDTFQINFQQASTLASKWISEKGKITLNIAETKNFILQYNKGIDIAVYADQSSYSFHLYRVESTLHLRRILMSLSLLLSGDNENFIEEESAEFTEAASVVDEAAEKAADDAQGEDYLSGNINTADLADLQELAEDIGEEETPPAPVVREPVVVPKAKPVPEAFDKLRIREFFTKKLYETDSDLFPTSESVRKKAKDEVKTKSTEQSYSIKCQSTDDRQPIVLNQEKYDAMKDEYKNDDVTFMEFPVRGVEPPSSGLLVPVLLYGAKSDKMNYYICCEYFCLRDYIMVLKTDFDGTSYRPPRMGPDGKEILKARESCPFCGGTQILDKKSPGPNQTVYKRKDNNKNKFIGLLQNTVHPKGIYQPCCFGRFPNYRVTDPKFAHLYYRPRTEEEEEEKGTVVTTSAQDESTYSLAIQRVTKKYIVEKTKFPLSVSSQGGPQIGLLLPILDSFFQQDDTKLIHTSQQKQELLPESEGFLRIGVDNSQLGKPDSFFSAIAPYLFKNSANEVRQEILRVIDPRNFLFLNYGNLLLEFYKSSDEGPTDSELRIWASSKKLDTVLKDSNKEAILRLWKSYHRFVEFVESRTTFKEYRQFAQMLAMPGFLSTRGLVLIVLDIVKYGETEKLEVRCPPYGYDNEQYENSDVGFIIHHYSGVWEPIFYVKNTRAKGGFTEKHEQALTFQHSQREDNWPKIVQNRVSEFTQKCAGPGRAAWTSASEVDPFAIIPVDRAIKGMPYGVEGVIRDAYNHIAALTFYAGVGKSELVALPVVDDGTIVTPKNIYFDWNDYTPASLPDIVNFYRENVDNKFSYYPGYKICKAVRVESTNKIVALQLRNGLFIPCQEIKSNDPSIDIFIKKSENEKDENEESEKCDKISMMSIVSVKDIEWQMNHDILFGKLSVSNDLKLLKSTESLVNEGYEYLRLIFSNWFSSENVSGELRKRVEDILFAKNLPLFEKRKRLQILLGTEILKWMDTEEEFKDEQKSLLRADCRLATGPKCPGQCVWKATQSKCLLHVPGETEVFVNVPEMLMRRLLDELLRFPERRQQLLEKKVSPLVSLKEAILVKNTYIVPDSSLAWYDLLNKDWGKTTKEEKKFYEEMSRDAPQHAVAEASEDAKARGALPQALKSMLGTEEETKDYYLYRAATKQAGAIMPLIVSLGTFPSELGMEDDALELTEDAMRQLTLKARIPIIQIDIRRDPPNYYVFSPAKRKKENIAPFIMVLTDAGPAMLSLSPSKAVPIPYERLSRGLNDLLDEPKLVSDSKKK